MRTTKIQPLFDLSGIIRNKTLLYYDQGFVSQFPLLEIFPEITGVGPGSKRVMGEYWDLIEKFGLIRVFKDHRLK
jgi:hypothetical protein